MRRINYKSDIPPLLLSLKVDENQITVPDCDFIVRFYIEGYEGRHYDCSHIGGVWSNCEPSEDGTKLVCYINNQRLGIGELCAEFHYISPDRRYSDGSQKSVVVIGSTELGVELVEDNGDAVTKAAIDVTLPFIYRTAYEIAREHGYTGTAEDFYGALASVVGIADAEKKRVTAEITRNANEQERIENEENRLNAENVRVNAEAQRVRYEAIRCDAESDRVEQEEDRKAKFEEITEFIATVRANEGNRESNELERQTNEGTRITEEAKRVAAEKKRAAEFEQQKLDLGGKIDRSGDEMGGDLIFTDNTGVSFSTSGGGAHTMFNDTDDVAKFTADNGDTFEFKQNETPNKSSSAVVVSADLYNALDMTLDSMGSALDGDAAYRAEAGDKIFNPDTGKIQRYNSTIGGFEDFCDPIEGKLYVNKMTDYIYRWNTKAKKMVFVGGVKAYTKEEADRRFAKLDDATQIVKVKELDAYNCIDTHSIWIGDEGLLLAGDGNGHLTVEQDEVITNFTLNEKLATKADDVAYGVEWYNGQPTGEVQETTVKDATKNTTVTTLILVQSFNALESELEKKADKTELDTINANVDQKVSKTDIVQNTGQSTTAVMSQKAVSDELSKIDGKVDELESEVIYDVTANNDGVTFDSLSALLSDENLSTLIPTSVRCGGMSIRFIQGSEQSSDNKYVQFRYMSSSTAVADFTNVSNWQGVDEEPTTGSNNLVKSGGVAEKIGMLKAEVDGAVSKNIIWSNGYINTTGSIMSSSLSIFTQPFLLKAGEKVTVGTKNANICIIGSTSADVLSVGDTISVIQITSSQPQFETHEYIASADTKIVLCVVESNYTLDFYNDDNLEARVEELEDTTPTLANEQDDLSLVDDNQNILALFRNGHIKTKYFDSSEVTLESQEDADVEICDKDDNTIHNIKQGHIKSKHFDSRDFETLKNYTDKNVHEYISAEHYNQIPIEKCGYDKICKLPIGSVYKGNVTRRYEQYNYIARIALFGDPHIGYGYSFASAGNIWKDWEDYIELSLKRASNKVPDFGIAMGDQLSSINEYIYESGGIGLIERNDWYNRIRQFNYPLFPIFGNHDNAIPDFTHTGVIEIANVRIIVFHMDIVYTTPLTTYNISDAEYSWLENAVKDSYNKGFITILASHYPIISDSSESIIPEEHIGKMLVQNHGQDLIDLCKTYNVRLHIHGHEHPTGLPYGLMTDNGVPFDMTEVEIGLCARAYVILEIRNDGFHFTEYPVTSSNGTNEEGGVRINHYKVLDDAPGRTLFVPLYNQASGTIRSDAMTPYPAGTE